MKRMFVLFSVVALLAFSGAAFGADAGHVTPGEAGDLITTVDTVDMTTGTGLQIATDLANDSSFSAYEVASAAETDAIVSKATMSDEQAATKINAAASSISSGQEAGAVLPGLNPTVSKVYCISFTMSKTPKVWITVNANNTPVTKTPWKFYNRQGRVVSEGELAADEEYYVAAYLDADDGEVTPVITQEASSTPATTHRSSSSGCDAGLAGVAGLGLVVAALLKKSCR